MKIHTDFPLKNILFYKIGGRAKVVLEVHSKDEIVEAIAFIQENNIAKYMVLALGANVLMSDKDYDGAIIWITKSEDPDIHVTSDGLVSVYSGQTLDELIHFGFHNDLIGLEALGGLPSSIGGAIRGNAGAFGLEMKDVLEKVEVLIIGRNEYELKEFSVSDCHFSYRDSFFKHHHKHIILRGFFQLQPATEEQLLHAKKKYMANIAYRTKNHPVEFPSCGSVFKNIKNKEQVEKMLVVWPDMKEQISSSWHGKISMGYVIKRLGFSGLQVGGAKITEKHANYISNIGNASAKDVKEIVKQIREKFEITFGFSPELEAEIL